MKTQVDSILTDHKAFLKKIVIKRLILHVDSDNSLHSSASWYYSLDTSYCLSAYIFIWDNSLFLILFLTFGIRDINLNHGSNPCPLHWKCVGLNHWTTREVIWNNSKFLVHSIQIVWELTVSQLAQSLRYNLYLNVIIIAAILGEIQTNLLDQDWRNVR